MRGQILIDENIEVPTPNILLDLDLERVGSCGGKGKECGKIAWTGSVDQVNDHVHGWHA